MQKIWNQRKQNAEEQKKTTRVDASKIRIQKDMSELDLPDCVKLHVPNPDDLMNFKVEIRPPEGFYQGGRFTFSIKVPSSYPHEAPKVLCEKKIYHPNIDLDGNVCLNILREDWNPVLSISSVVLGLLHLFADPNVDDPLNKEAAEDLHRDRAAFAQHVARTLRGHTLNGVRYDNVVSH